ncbi:MAG: RluA family pseudouridine synthase [Caldisericia bacterium]|nr:RluA family pseudouridine synthase [Caldisericia bacterium]MDD4614831.1 RluA family pseudouridine synthase [Caldisericia bacterium]
MLKNLVISESYNGVRLDRLVAAECNITRTKAVELIFMGFITVDDVLIRRPGLKVKKGQFLQVNYPDVTGESIKGENIPLDIVYEDDEIIVVNKPKGMLTHPTPKESTGTLVNALMYHSRNLANVYGAERAGIIHRLDRDTSGILVTAKTNRAHTFIADQFQNRDVEKYYIAIVYGTIKDETTDIIVPLLVNHKLRKVVPSQNGKFSATRAYKIWSNNEYSILKVRIFTGRTHQIRVHMQYIGHPVVGDLLYGYNQHNIPYHETSVFIPPKKITIDQLTRDEAEVPTDLEDENYDCNSDNNASDPMVDPPVTAQYKVKEPSHCVDYSKPIPLLLHSYSLRFKGLHSEDLFFTCTPPACFFDFINDHNIDFDLSKL